MNNTFSTNENTRVYQHHDNSWYAETKVTINGKNWVITTTKWHRGIGTHCHTVKDEGNGAYSFMMFDNKKPNEDFFLNMQPKTTRATEKTVRAVHFESLAIFDKMKENGELPAATDEPQIKIGQIIFTDGPGYDPRRRAVYEISANGDLKTVLLDGSDIEIDQHVREIGKKFGIGSYFTPGETIPEAEVNELLITAHETIKARETAKNIHKQVAAEKRTAQIAEGAKILPELPAGVVSVIVAQYQRNESDMMTDYFGSSTEKTIYLAFSTHNRDLFSEMRKAAVNCPETAFLADAPAEWENREKYSMGAGYYLGEHRHSGWQIRKRTIYSPATELENMQVAIAQGAYFIPTSTTPETTPAAPVEISAEGLQIVDYSEKAFAVIGNTKAIKDTLKTLGGRFNFRLTCGPGWIFSKKQLDSVKAALNIQ